MKLSAPLVFFQPAVLYATHFRTLKRPIGGLLILVADFTISASRKKQKLPALPEVSKYISVWYHIADIIRYSKDLL